jgi:hypothetical protein
MEDEETVSRITTATSRISKTKTDALFDILDSDDEDEVKILFFILNYFLQW